LAKWYKALIVFLHGRFDLSIPPLPVLRQVIWLRGARVQRAVLGTWPVPGPQWEKGPTDDSECTRREPDAGVDRGRCVSDAERGIRQPRDVSLFFTQPRFVLAENPTCSDNYRIDLNYDPPGPEPPAAWLSALVGTGCGP
jgi:hypothetical protein